MGQYYITQCNAVIITTRQVINVISFVFVQNKCKDQQGKHKLFDTVRNGVKSQFPLYSCDYPLLL